MSILDHFSALVLATVSNGFGVCAKCMRISFLAAAFSVIFATIIFASTSISWLLITGVLAAGCFLAIWLVHLTAYAVRTAKQLGRKVEHRVIGSAVVPQMKDTSSEFDRRDFVWAAIGAFATAAVFTIFPSGISRAQTACTITSCYDPECSCVAPTPQCAFCPNRSEFGCMPSAAVPCCSNDAFWYCLNGTQCNGDGTYTPYCR